MCGFVGCLDLYERRPTDEQALRAMTAMLAHRGPDSEGILIDAGFGVGFRRLAVVDLEGGDQPLFNEDRSIVLVCNGEVFNDSELAAQQLGDRHQLRTRSDCEVIVHLYEELGDRLLEAERWQEAADAYRAVLDRDPLHEASYRQLMRCLTHTGERTQALRLYQRLSDTLRTELATTPAAETVRLYKQLQASAD